MAHLVPDIEEIKSFPTPLTKGELTLIIALLDILDNRWTIYVQPHLNGLNPDVVIFSEEAGIGIFEVKDWNLENYTITGARDKYNWNVYNSNTDELVKLHMSKCPFNQVEKYKNSIYQFELPVLREGTAKNSQLYSLVVPFVYFYGSSSSDVLMKCAPILDKHRYAFGDDKLEPEKLRELLSSHYLRPGSKFAKWMKEQGISARLRNALCYPEHGKIDPKFITGKLTAKQRDLLPSPPRVYRRVIGVAGSGKTFVIVRKAVDAALKGKKVLVVCFNITMVNYLRDVITRLARYYDKNCNRNIEVGHFHRIAKSHKLGKRHKNALPFSIDESAFEDDSEIIADCYMGGNFDVLLIDEGQDFRKEWIEILQGLCHPDFHFLFVEDDCQDIYLQKKARGTVPKVSGPPNKLKTSFRIPDDIAILLNDLLGWSKFEGESETIERKESRPLLMPTTHWFNGTFDQTLSRMITEITHQWNNGSLKSPADNAVLVCDIAGGRKVYEYLNAVPIPTIATFENQQEYDQLKSQYPDEPDFDRVIDEVRRSRKVAFWMETGRLKLSTIHSFKGWELNQIFVLFTSNMNQAAAISQLLYTAMSRTQNTLYVFNSHPYFVGFGERAIKKGLALQHQLP